MAIACFWIPANNPWDAQDDLNKFLAAHRVLAMDRHFVANGNDSAWSVAVDYADGGRASQTGNAPDKSRVDYREVLDPATFALFAALRTKRKELAEQDGVPAYVIVTNEQMAQIARMRAASMDDLKQVAGLGENRLRRYGRALLETIAATTTSVSGLPQLRTWQKPSTDQARGRSRMNRPDPRFPSVGSLSEGRSKALGRPYSSRGMA